MRRLLPLVCVLTCAPAANAAPPWSPFEPVSGEHTFVDRPEVVYTAGGTAIATWSFGDSGGSGGHQLAVRGPGAAEFGSERTLPRADTLLPPVPYGRNRFAIAFERRGRLSAAFGSATSGRIGRTQHVRSSRDMLRPSLAANSGGVVALVWFENRGTSNDRVYISLRRAGEAFRRPVLLATDRVRQTAVAVSAQGAVLVAWETSGRIRVRAREGGARRFGRVQTLTSQPTFGAAPRAAFAPGGRAFIAWAGQSGTEEGPRGPVEVAVRGAGSSRFRAAQTLELAGRHQGRLSLAIGRDGAARVAWDSDGFIRTSAETGAATFALPQVLGAGIDADVALATDGRAVVAWQSGDEERSLGVMAAYKPATGAFGAPEQVSDRGEARVPAVAFGPAGSTLLLSNRTTGAPPALAYAYDRAG